MNSTVFGDVTACR